MQLRPTGTIRGQQLWPARSVAVVPDLITALGDIPKLDGAACVEHVDIFDAGMVGNGAEAREAQAQCIAVCSMCPALAACRRWAETLPSRERQSLGVLAGEARTVRPRKPAQRPRTATNVRSADRQRKRALVERHRAARRAARAAS